MSNPYQEALGATLIERTFRERIVLVGVTLGGHTDEDTEDGLDELSLLVDTAGADEAADGTVQQLARAQDDQAALALQRDAAFQQRAVGVLLDLAQFAQQRAGTVDDARQAVVGGKQQRGGRRQEERRGQHRGEHGVVGGRSHGPVAGKVCVMMT